MYYIKIFDYTREYWKYQQVGYKRSIRMRTDSITEILIAKYKYIDTKKKSRMNWNARIKT